jgi:RND family efflux transporter MFP subunit
MTFSLTSAGRAVAMLAIVVAIGCNKGNEYKAPPPAEVTVAKPVIQPVRDFLEFTGKTAAVDTVDIRSRVSGYLKSIEFRDGQTVKKGQRLFVIEPEPFEAALASADADRQKANAKLELSQAETRRMEPLVKGGAVSAQEWDVAVANRATAAADVAAATAAMKQAKLNLSYTEVLAPIDGRISRHMVDIGNLVQTQTTVLTTIQSYAPIYAYFYVSENDLDRLNELKSSATAELSKNGKPAGPKISLQLSNEKGFPHEGRIDFAELGVDPTTSKQLRRAVFDNQDGTLLPGLFCRLQLPIGDRTPRLMVADRSIATDQRGDYVLVVNQENVVEYRPVQLGLVNDNLRVIDSGIKGGEWVVTNGLQRARPGAKVEPKQTVLETANAKAGPATTPVVTTKVVGEVTTPVKTAISPNPTPPPRPIMHAPEAPGANSPGANAPGTNAPDATKAPGAAAPPTPTSPAAQLPATKAGG